MSQSQFSFPSNAFKQYDINIEAGSSSYDNAMVLDMAQNVYHFAQQRSSRLLPLLNNVGSMKGQFIQQDRFGGFEFQVRTTNIGDTPHSKHANSTRGATSVKLHAGHIMDMDDVGATRYAIQPRVQLELANSLGRTIDRVIHNALYKDVVEYTSTAGASFQGTETATVKSLPDSSKFVLGSKQASSTKALIRWTSYAVDDLVESFEKDDWNASDICLIITPELSRQFKKIPDFRDAENNQSFEGNENTQVFSWRDITCIKLSQKIAPPVSAVAGTTKFAIANQFAPVASGGAALSGFTGYSDRAVTYAFAKDAIKFRFHHNLYSRIAKRTDKQDAVELYARVALACLRVDDSGVRQLVFGKAEPGSNDGA